MQTSATMTIVIGQMAFTGRADFVIIPGEPMVRYYADGSGYPGSPPEIDDRSFTVDEVEYPGPDCDEPWGYKTREELGDCVAIADRWCTDALQDGSYDDELFDDADYPEEYDRDD